VKKTSKPTKLHDYIVYRHGSNAANQSMTASSPVYCVEARNPAEALKLARESGEFTVYNNQHLSVKASTRVTAEERQIAWEDTRKP